jgi:Tfp pilus assembly protein PilE
VSLSIRAENNTNDGICASCGHSLVELLVSAAVASVIVLGALQLYLSNQEAARLQNALVHLHENGRFVLRFMRTVLRLAGSRNDWRAMGAGNQLGASSTLRIKAPPIIWSMTHDGVRFDTLTVQYETGPDGGNTCTGSVADPNTWYFSQYDVIPFSGDASLLQLVCRTGVLQKPVYGVAETIRTVGARQTGILVAGADAFQVLYGVRRRTMLSGGPERYVSAHDVDHGQEEVLTVRIGVLLSEPDYHSTEIARVLMSRNIEVLDQRYDARALTAALTVNGVLPLRRVFETTVLLRNGPVLWSP